MPNSATDRSTVNRVVNFVGAIALVGVIGMIALALTSHPIPPELATVVAGAVTAEAALLANTRSVDPAAVQQAGYQSAVADVQSLAAPAPVAAPGPAQPPLPPAGARPLDLPPDFGGAPPPPA